MECLSGASWDLPNSLEVLLESHWNRDFCLKTCLMNGGSCSNALIFGHSVGCTHGMPTWTSLCRQPLPTQFIALTVVTCTWAHHESLKLDEISFFLNTFSGWKFTKGLGDPLTSKQRATSLLLLRKTVMSSEMLEAFCSVSARVSTGWLMMVTLVSSHIFQQPFSVYRWWQHWSNVYCTPKHFFFDSRTGRWKSESPQIGLTQLIT